MCTQRGGFPRLHPTGSDVFIADASRRRDAGMPSGVLGCRGAPTCRGLVAWVPAAAALPVAPSPGLQQADAERQAPGSESSHPNQERGTEQSDSRLGARGKPCLLPPAGPAWGKTALTPISRAPRAIFTLSPCPCPVWARGEGEKQPPCCLKSQFIAVNGAPPCRSPPRPSTGPSFAPRFARLSKVSGYSRRT